MLTLAAFSADICVFYELHIKLKTILLDERPNFTKKQR